ncbi:olfactory receptor 7D4-like [Castor canadensis]|uniref:Olfactory receptor 7D4-like n=1 Tax=Castor canadensis TaxID=51338 RepID=A0AC58KWW8_CASCN
MPLSCVWVFTSIFSTVVEVKQMSTKDRLHKKKYMGIWRLIFSLFLIGIDNFLLTIMACDHFVAICHPLNYTVFMNLRLCILLVLMSWFIIMWVSLIHILPMRQLMFSLGTEILHFFCELDQLLKVSKSDTLINNIFVYAISVLLGVFPVTGILISYSQIVSAVMKMTSIASKYKAFSTCGSNICVVSLYFSTRIGFCLSSTLVHSSQRNTIASVMYNVVTLMLNPFINSLRNKEVKGALGRLLSTASSCLRTLTSELNIW